MHYKYEFRIRLTTDSGYEFTVDGLTFMVGCAFEEDVDITITPNVFF